MSTQTRAVAGGLVAVLSLLVAGCAGDPREGFATSETLSASSASPPSPTSTTTAGVVAWVDGLPVGPPPRIGYVIGHTYHSADGRTVRLPRDLGSMTAHGPSGTPRLHLPSPRIRRAVCSRAWEDDRHVLVGLARGREAAVLRLDVRSDRWELTVDWTSTVSSFGVAFETRP